MHLNTFPSADCQLYYDVGYQKKSIFPFLNRNPGNGGMSQRGHGNHVQLTRLRWHLPHSSTPVKGPGFRPSKRLCLEEEDLSAEFQSDPLD